MISDTFGKIAKMNRATWMLGTDMGEFPTRSVRRAGWDPRHAALLESDSGIDVAPTVTSNSVNARQCSAKRSKQPSEAYGRLCPVLTEIREEGPSWAQEASGGQYVAISCRSTPSSPNYLGADIVCPGPAQPQPPAVLPAFAI